MKYLLSIITLLFLCSCGGGSKQLSEFDSITADHERIAVVPIKSKLRLPKKQMEKITESELNELELQQSLKLQDAIESYLVGKSLRVRIQSLSVTNAKLKDAGINLSLIDEVSVLKLNEILGVDAVVSGYFECEKPMSDLAATGIEIAKQLERQLVGSFFGNNINTSTHRAHCSVSLFESKYGDRIWSFQDDIEMGKGSTTQDVINTLMKNGSKNFPYIK